MANDLWCIGSPTVPPTKQGRAISITWPERFRRSIAIEAFGKHLIVSRDRSIAAGAAVGLQENCQRTSKAGTSSNAAPAAS